MLRLAQYVEKYEEETWQTDMMIAMA